jgi:hypothetical protein
MPMRSLNDNIKPKGDFPAFYPWILFILTNLVFFVKVRWSLVHIKTTSRSIDLRVMKPRTLGYSCSLSNANATNSNNDFADYAGIGRCTPAPSATLAVNGIIHAEEITVGLHGPDYVFEPTCNLPSLTEIESYIKANKHLPEVPSAKDMEANGINLSEMNMLLLKKVEKLTLHLIGASKTISEQNEFILGQNDRINNLEIKLK